MNVLVDRRRRDPRQDPRHRAGRAPREFASGPDADGQGRWSPGSRSWPADWKYDAVSIGYPGPGAARPAGRRAAQPGPRLGRLRLRGRLRPPGQGHQRRRDAGAGQLQGRQDAVPGPGHRPRLHADRGRHRRADGAGPPAVQEGDLRGLRRRPRASSGCGKKKWRRARRGRGRAPGRRPRARRRRARRRQRQEAEEAAAGLPRGRQRQRVPRAAFACGRKPRKPRAAERQGASPARDAAKERKEP